MFDVHDVEGYLAHLRGKGFGESLGMDAARPSPPEVRTWTGRTIQLALLRSGNDVWLESRSVHPVYGVTPMNACRDPAGFRNFILETAREDSR